jgi:hypothetical protein
MVQVKNRGAAYLSNVWTKLECLESTTYECMDQRSSTISGHELMSFSAKTHVSYSATNT